jgi:hypothetical protein
VGFIPVGNADNMKIRSIVVDSGGPIRFGQRTKYLFYSLQKDGLRHGDLTQILSKDAFKTLTSLI